MSAENPCKPLALFKKRCVRCGHDFQTRRKGATVCRECLSEGVFLAM